jgi:hypothetical protein
VSAERPGCPTRPNSSERRLLARGEVISLLQLSSEKVEHLIDTGQLTKILIEGEERFDSRDVYQLIDTYISTASRRSQ